VSTSFLDLGVSPRLAARLRDRGILSPFPIQRATIPDALAGRDVCGRAPTGSGKTLAFGAAVVGRATGAAPRRPRALVLVPTRELAAQVQRELAALSDDQGRRVLAVYGGTGYGPAERALARGVDVLVACPGRLEDLVARRTVDLSDVSIAVLDEADRMADMGFLPAVRRLLDATAPDRQVLLFSATLGPEIETLVDRYQRNPARHDVVADEGGQGDVAHHFWATEREHRVDLTARLVGEHGRALVFCRTRRGADRVARQLVAAGVDAIAIHGDRTQGQRERALSAFAGGRARALVATDVAARGIHVDDLPCVVHFDPPADHTDYLHRSGRTGRAGRAGTVVSLVTKDQHAAVGTLQRTLGLHHTLHLTPPHRAEHRRNGSGEAAPVEAEAEEAAVVAATVGAAAPATVTRRPSAPAPPTAPAARRPAAGRVRPDRASRRSRQGPVGTVTYVNTAKGYGFVSRPDGDDLFVHRTNVVGRGFSALEAGQRVAFMVAAGRRGPEARDVRAI
jgi:superfamily II DNA/RNA helicase